MGAITATETSRTTVTFYTLPYTISLVSGLPLLQSLSALDLSWQDRALVCTGGLQSTDLVLGIYIASYDQVTLDELSTTSATQTTYGSGTPLQRMFFGTFNEKFFYSEHEFFTAGDSRNGTNYGYVDYTEGASLGAITFTHYAMDASWLHPSDLNQPITWSGLTTAVCLTTDIDPSVVGAVPVRGLLVDGSGLTSASQICVAPAAANEGGRKIIHMMIPGAGKNYFVHRPDLSGIVASMPVWTADDTGTNLTSDDLSFEAADVNLAVVNDFNWFGNGFWTITPDAFIFYCSRNAWDVVNSVTPVNGLVVVTLQKDFTSYTVKFITWGDDNAQAILDNADQYSGALEVDSTGRLYYSNGDYGAAGCFLSELVAPPPPPPGDVLDTLPRFPPGIALGATGGPGFKTSIAPGDRGTRFQEWDKVRGTYQVDCLVKDQDQINELLTFFRARRGRAFPFRFKDWSDYQLPDPTSGLDYAVVFITNVTGGTVQLIKVYDDLAGEYVRAVTRPVYGTLQVFDDGVLTTDYTIDYSTGIMTLGDTLAATSGHEIGVVCEFDVKARFDTDTMTVTISSLEVYSWKSVPILELFDGP